MQPDFHHGLLGESDMLDAFKEARRRGRGEVGQGAGSRAAGTDRAGEGRAGRTEHDADPDRIARVEDLDARSVAAGRARPRRRHRREDGHPHEAVVDARGACRRTGGNRQPDRDAARRGEQGRGHRPATAGARRRAPEAPARSAAAVGAGHPKRRAARRHEEGAADVGRVAGTAPHSTERGERRGEHDGVAQDGLRSPAWSDGAVDPGPRAAQGLAA